jgi:hypothetical protein
MPRSPGADNPGTYLEGTAAGRMGEATGLSVFFTDC